MRIAALLYHDIIADGAGPDASGFAGAGASVYKLAASAFAAHLAAIARRVDGPPLRIADQPAPDTGPALPWLLTFDDGGVSASLAADSLAARGWTGHFFITGSKIGDPAFVDGAAIRQLVRAGHVVGSHSWSHPPRMSALPFDEIRDEWLRSIRTLEDLTGEPVRIASVPGGFYSTTVARAAAAAGIRVLFNSEPVLRCSVIDGCVIAGRFSIRRSATADQAAALAAGRLASRVPEWLGWNARKLVKSVAGSGYERVRERWLDRTGPGR